MMTIIVESALRSMALGAAVWIGLKALRVRNTQTRSMAWSAVLFAALLMPLLMQWRTVSVPVPRVVRTLPVPHVQHVVHTVAALPQTPRAEKAAFNWRVAIESAYVAVALLLLLRMTIGLLLMARLLRRASAVHESWANGLKVRCSEEVAVPVTFGSTVLLPADWPSWDETKRRAVLVHERSHVQRGDFYLQTLSALHRVIFWFSPLAWMLHRQLAELMEAASDEAAVLDLQDRPSYAEILMQFAGRPDPSHAVVAMARQSTVSRRVERILAETFLPPKAGRTKSAIVVASVAGIVALVAGCTISAQPAPQPNPRPQVQSATTTTDEVNEPYAIISKHNSTMSGSTSDIRRATMLRDKLSGDYIWFEHDLKYYYITDPALVAKATELFAPEQELGEKQGELGELQGKLGEEQGKLGEQQSEVTVSVPDFTRQMDELKKQLEAMRAEFAKSANKEISQDSISDLQSKLGDLQGRLGELQSRAGEKQSKLGELQSKLGEEQAKLGEEQAKLGEEQERMTEKATRELRKLLEEALRAGLAKPVE